MDLNDIKKSLEQVESASTGSRNSLEQSSNVSHPVMVRADYRPYATTPQITYVRPIPRPQYPQQHYRPVYGPVIHNKQSDASLSGSETEYSSPISYFSPSVPGIYQAGPNPSLGRPQPQFVRHQRPPSPTNSNYSSVSDYAGVIRPSQSQYMASVPYSGSHNVVPTQTRSSYPQFARPMGSSTPTYSHYASSTTGEYHGTVQRPPRPQYIRPQRPPSPTNTNYPRRNSDVSVISQSNTTHILSTIPHENLESYRQQVKKSNDIVQQFQFAKQLILVAEEMRKNPQGLDANRVRKNRDILHSEAVRWIKKAAQVPHFPEASFFLADCYGNGTLGLTVDHDRAFGYYLQGSKQDHPASIYRTGVCYEVGAGTKRDHARAVQYYKKAAALGDTAAMYKIGMILMNGQLGQQKNPREGVNFLKRAAGQADETTPFALHELAKLYEGPHDPSTGVVPDPNYAFELYHKSAKLGYAASQYKLGLAYEYGHLGLRIDPPRSIAWYTKAAEQGDPDAELALSGWYLTGHDPVLPRNDEEAYLWARKAAEKGLAKAEYAVGYFMEYGVGTAVDLEEARRWYVRSASQGNSRAVARLKGAQQDTKPANWRSDVDARNGNCSVM